MGNAAGTESLAPYFSPASLQLRKGKRITGCPCVLSEQASTWEAITLHDKFRPYVLRHLLDEGFICSVLEHGEREQSLGACEGVLYFKVCWLPEPRQSWIAHGVLSTCIWCHLIV